MADYKSKIVLASSSRYRAELLSRLGLAFETWSPNVDESALSGEACVDTARRLARLKAQTAQRQFPGAIVIGSDQVADLDGKPINKPGTLERAREQLRAMSGRSARFHTALCLIGATGLHEAVVPTDVRFRHLSPDEIDRYLAKEPAIDCAGSAKSEGLGVALLEAMTGDDPTALIGLPLIALAGMLRAEGLPVP